MPTPHLYTDDQIAIARMIDRIDQEVQRLEALHLPGPAVMNAQNAKNGWRQVRSYLVAVYDALPRAEEVAGATR